VVRSAGLLADVIDRPTAAARARQTRGPRAWRMSHQRRPTQRDSPALLGRCQTRREGQPFLIANFPRLRVSARPFGARIYQGARTDRLQDISNTGVERR
jgi:hypothetical protein